MSEATFLDEWKVADQSSTASFAVARGFIDTTLVSLFESRAIRRSLRNQGKLSLSVLGVRAQNELAAIVKRHIRQYALEPIAIHERLVRGLPGQALFISASLAFESLVDALPYFDVTAKTAWQKIEQHLSPAESEQALRLGRAAIMASELLGSPDAGRRYLRTKNFALGGVTPLDLLKTAEGEQLVLGELQSHSAGGPV